METTTDYNANDIEKSSPSPPRFDAFGLSI